MQVKSKRVKLTRIFLISLFAFIFFGYCSHRLIKKENLYEFNEYYKDKTYYLKDNVNVGNNETIKKGASVKIWIESTASLLKVKCYPSEEEREYSIGKLIIYLVNEEYKDKTITKEALDKIIEEKLVLYNPKNRRHKTR